MREETKRGPVRGKAHLGCGVQLFRPFYFFTSHLGLGPGGETRSDVDVGVGRRGGLDVEMRG